MLVKAKAAPPATGQAASSKTYHVDSEIFAELYSRFLPIYRRRFEEVVAQITKERAVRDA